MKYYIFSHCILKYVMHSLEITRITNFSPTFSSRIYFSKKLFSIKWKYVLAHENKILFRQVQANMLSKNPLPTYV